MGFAPFIIALGDAPEVELQAAAEVDIAPADDSVNSNRVRVVGEGTVSSLGVACGGLRRSDVLPPEDEAATDDVMTVTKQVTWDPSGAGILLKHNPPGLSLLGGVDRLIKTKSFGEYQSDVDGWWTELQFSQSDLPPVGDGGLISFVVYSSSQTITIPPNCTKAWIRMWGASGAAGGTGDVNHASAGVGSGGYLEKYQSGLVPGKTLIFTRGNGGITQNNGAGAWYGQPGSASTLVSGTQSIGTLTANGSNGTDYAGTGPGSPGGTASGGDLNYTGQSGGPPQPTPSGFGPGVGGARLFSRGPDGSTAVQGTPGIPGGLVIAWFR